MFSLKSYIMLYIYIYIYIYICMNLSLARVFCGKTLTIADQHTGLAARRKLAVQQLPSASELQQFHGHGQSMCTPHRCGVEARPRVLRPHRIDPSAMAQKSRSTRRAAQVSSGTPTLRKWCRCVARPHRTCEARCLRLHAYLCRRKLLMRHLVRGLSDATADGTVPDLHVSHRRSSNPFPNHG